MCFFGISDLGCGKVIKVLFWSEEFVWFGAAIVILGFGLVAFVITFEAGVWLWKLVLYDII